MMEKAIIMVVDDEPDICNLTRIILEDGGYMVQTASDSREAFTALEKCKPDLILLDIWLPGMDGYGICRRLKDGLETASIPLVMFTVSSSRQARERSLKAGADGFLEKPFTMDGLLEVVGRHLGG